MRDVVCWSVLCLLGLAFPAARGVEQADVNRAIARGVAHLRTIQGGGGSWPYQDSGATSLAALTLMECGVAADDPAIVRAAAYLRQDSVKLTHTYSISLAILFFDRLGDVRDVPLLESLMVRLMAGQGADGGWSYNCPPIADSEVRRLSTHVTRRNELRTGPALPAGKRSMADLPPEVQRQVAAAGGGIGGFGSDNSNTQFGVLALWVGRKYGLPVDAALGRVGARFRVSQKPNGTWGYVSGPTAPGVPMLVDPAGGATSSAAMTCAGAISIAVAHGVTFDPDNRGPKPDLSRDLALQRALVALGQSIGEPGGKVPPIGEGNGKAYYFLWSVERVCVALNLDRLGGKDWYNWGAEILLGNQQQDGSWRGEYGNSGADTCFALLFLKRANLARDLSANLKAGLQARTIKAGPGLPGGGEKVKPALTRDDTRPTEKPRETPRAKPIPTESENAKAERFSDELVGSRGGEREAVLKKLQTTSGREYTEALAMAIPRLEGEDRQKVRDALQIRMQRLKEGTLAEYLKEKDPEFRAAAALAVAVKGHRQLIPQLIDGLKDLEPYVARAAHVALKELTKEDFGPEEGAGREEMEKAVNAWKDWWKKNGSP
jgi:hypothetical protein